MQYAQKWNFRSKTYEPVELPDGCSCCETDMETRVLCPACRKEFTYGEMYTSRQYHTQHGMGYAVCRECYQREWAQEL